MTAAAAAVFRLAAVAVVESGEVGLLVDSSLAWKYAGYVATAACSFRERCAV